MDVYFCSGESTMLPELQIYKKGLHSTIFGCYSSPYTELLDREIFTIQGDSVFAFYLDKF